MLIGETLKGLPRDQVVVSVKFGALRDPAGGWSGNESAATGARMPSRPATSARTANASRARMST